MTPSASHLTSCVGKIKHHTKAGAINARDGMLRRPNRRKVVVTPGSKLEPYRCSACGFFHLGHS